MYSSQEWWNAAAGGGGDPGDPIGQSLRFRNASTGGQTLRRNQTAGSTEYTVSFWTKLGPIGRSIDSILYQTNSSSTGPSLYINFNPGAGANSSVLMSSDTTVSTAPRKMRDPSAWYHIVYQFSAANGNRNRIFVNGEQWADVSGNDKQITAGTFSIGANANGPQPQFEGLMADWYFIDGQVLPPSAFGRVNDYGVWVPKAVDFTPATMRYSDNVYANISGTFTPDTTSKDFYPGLGDQPLDAFDGSTSTTCLGPNNGFGWTYYNFPDGLTDLTGFRVWLGYTSEARINEVAATVTTGSIGGTSSWVEFGSLPSSITQFAVKNESPNVARVGAFEVTDADGTRILTNPFLWSNHLFTSPGIGSIDYTSTAKNFQGGSPVENGFDNQSNTFVQCDSSNSWFFKPQGLIASKIEIQVTNAYGDPTGGALEFNGVEQTGFPGQSWYTVYEGTPISDWTIGGWYRPDGGNGFSMIRVNGVVLRDGYNPSYGENGFHLDFSDPNDIGADRSGNGNNFTPTGFNTIKTDGGSLLGNSGTPANQQVALGTVQLGSLPQLDTGNRAQIYDIDFGREVESFTQRYRTTNMENRWMQLFISNTGNADDWTQIDERQFGPAANAAYDFHVDFPSPARYLRITQTATQGATWQPGVWNIQFVDDVINPDYDLMQDSPTQNYATFNPLKQLNEKPSNPINANLGYQATDNVGAGTIYLPESGDYYWEIETDPTFNIKLGAAEQFGGATVRRVELELRNGQNVISRAVSLPGTFTAATGSNPSSGLIGVHADVTNGVFEFILDGVVNGRYVGDSDDLAGLEIYAGGSTGTLTFRDIFINFGQQPWIGTPPAGATGLQTQNLPAAPIPNGRDHFQPITAPGVGYLIYAEGIPGKTTEDLDTDDLSEYSPVTTFGQNGSYVLDTFETRSSLQFTNASGWQSVLNEVYLSNDGVTWTQNSAGITLGSGVTVNFTPDTPSRYFRFSWVNASGSGGTAGFGNIQATDGVSPVLSFAKREFPNGLWWIKDRDNNGHHQLVDSLRGSTIASTCPDEASEQTYAAPPGLSIAWCWKAGDGVVTNNAGTLESQVSANTDAGFSIVTYTGNGANASATIGHGLNQAPEFMILMFRNTTGQRTVYHEAIGNTSRLRLNSNIPVDTNIGHWNNTSPTDEVFTVGNNFNQGPVWNYVTYCWHSVPGYSAFGSYESNNADDGPFCYLGFRPAFLMVKNADLAQDVSGEPATGSWMIVDSTRDVDNPTTQYLRANFTGPEYNGRGSHIDLLSNGFKLRGSYGEINGGTNTYVYCAWAENPFQSPTAAR